jgi:hypothetical protein
VILQGFDARKQKTKAKKKFQLCRLLQSAKLGKKTPESLPTATLKAVGKEHFKKKIFSFFADCRAGGQSANIF